MLLVVGDIHGCFDGLKKLFDKEVIDRLKDEYKRLKVIFLGDYIDHGPCSKEVLDFIIDLDIKEKVFLMGNHEDLLLMYFKGHEIYERWGNQWICPNNGGIATIKSLDPDSELFKMFAYKNLEYERFHPRLIKNDGLVKFDKKYMDFFESLKYTHIEEITFKGRKRKILFSHSVPNVKVPIEELLSVKTYEEYHALHKKYEIFIEENSLWNRDELAYLNSEYDYLLIHGHTPTCYLDKYYKGEIKDIIEHNNSYVQYYPICPIAIKKGNVVRSINMDLGLVYGKGIAFLMIPENDEEFGDDIDAPIRYYIVYLAEDGFRNYNHYTNISSSICAFELFYS